MGSEHTPLTDAELDKLLTFPVQALNVETTLEQLVAEIREQRRLLRAVEWGGTTASGTASCCPECGAVWREQRHGDCDLGRYLATCEGKGET